MTFFKNHPEITGILKSLTLFIILLFILIGIGELYKKHEKTYPSTQDATLQANIIPLSTNISGRVNQVNVKNDELVTEGTVLFTLDDTREKNAYDNALIAEKQANDTYQRNVTAGAAGGISQEKIETLKTALKSAQVNLMNAKYQFDNTIVHAKRDGILSNFYLQAGQYLTPNNIVGGLIVKHSAWVQANILEPFIENIRSGQEATFEFRMYPGLKFKGVVESVGYAIQTAPSQENTVQIVDPRFNWVYLSKRFPVRIKVLSEDPFKTTPFRVGATVNVTITTEKYVKDTGTH